MSAPNGYPTVSPYLVCRQADRVIAFAQQALGAELLRRFPAPDGTVMHAELRIGDSVVMIGDAGGQWAPIPTNLHVYVDDVDAAHARAIAAGAENVQTPEEKKDGDRRGGVRDPGGNTWWLATTVTAEGA